MAYPPQMIADMYASYQRGRSLSWIARQWCLHRQAVGDAFRRRGLALRPCRMPRMDPRTGRFEALKPLSEAQISALIAKATRVTVPRELRAQWRHWDLPTRAAFIDRLWAKVGRKGMPSGPFSASLRAFRYGTPEAHEIVDRLNHGRESRRFVARIVPNTPGGVIWRGQLWFWTPKVGYALGVWRPGIGRPLLHHVAWEFANNRPVPAGHVVSLADGNWNNIDPSNLVLRTRNDVCRSNQAAALLAKSRARTAALLNQVQNPNEHTEILASVRRRRVQR